MFDLWVEFYQITFVNIVSSWQGLTFTSGRSFIRKRFLLKLSFRTFAQLKALILVWPYREQSQESLSIPDLNGEI